MATDVYVDMGHAGTRTWPWPLRAVVMSNDRAMDMDLYLLDDVISKG